MKLRFKSLAELVAFRNWRLRLRPLYLEHAESSDLGERLSRHRAHQFFTGPSVRLSSLAISCKTLCKSLSPRAGGNLVDISR